MYFLLFASQEHWTAGVNAVITPAAELFKYATTRKKRISPYEVDETAYHDAVAAELSIEDSVGRLQAQVEQLEADEAAFNKFSFKGYSDDAAQQRKRKLAKMRRRLEAKIELAEELRVAALEAAAKKQRDENLAKAAEEVEAVQERMLLVNQLAETIKLAHRGAKQAAAAV